MSDPITTSRAARESLARGLNALQADASVPAHLVELAAPIAQAMGALHQVEKTQQLLPHAEIALNHVRGAMNQLQAQPPTHPAVAAALEAVAASLSMVHGLHQMANGRAPEPHAQPAPAPAAIQPPAYQAPPPQMPMQPPAQHAYAAPVQGPPMVAADPFAAPGRAHAHPGAPPPQAAPPHYQGAPPAQVHPQYTPPANVGPVQTINADLGAHSPTNFYKGLAGNDVIDHGGLFVSTYVSPPIGQPVRLRISLPGGYEFEADATVKWTREQGGDAPPGFGARFTRITPEARQLVYRYVRNREPLFYDDF